VTNRTENGIVITTQAEPMNPRQQTTCLRAACPRSLQYGILNQLRRCQPAMFWLQTQRTIQQTVMPLPPLPVISISY